MCAEAVCEVSQGDRQGEASVPAEPGGGPSYGRLRTLAARSPWLGTVLWDTHPDLLSQPPCPLESNAHPERGGTPSGLRLGVWGPGNDHVGHCPPSGSVLTADPSPRRPEGQCMLPDRSLQSNAWVFRDRTASLGSPPSSRLGFSTGLISVLGCFSQGPNKQVGSGKSGPTRDGPLGGGASHVRGTG